MGAFGGPEKDWDFCSGKPVLVQSVVATVSAVLVVSTGATLVVSTLHGPSCFSTLGGIPAPVVFDTDNFPPAPFFALLFSFSLFRMALEGQSS